MVRKEDDGFSYPDPAERSAFMRLFYRDRRPTWFGHVTSQFWAHWARIGLPPRLLVALEVRSRESGEKRSDAVMTPRVAGNRYIVSMFGAISDWVQNLEASDGHAVIYHGSAEPVRLVIIPVEERAPVIKEFVRIAASGRKHVPVAYGAPLAEFAAIAANYPVYRVEKPD